MTGNYYRIFNQDDFLALELPSMEYEVILQGVGLKTILVTLGNYVSMLYEGVFLPVNLNDRNPFVFEGHSVFIDSQNDVWLGIEDS